jgi:hypothetical protein
MKEIYLNDSTIVEIQYSQETQDIELTLELSNCMQEGYQVGDPDFTFGRYIFKRASFSPEELTLIMREIDPNKNLDGEILKHDVKENGDLIVSELFVRIINYATRKESYANITINSKACEWKPERTFS